MPSLDSIVARMAAAANSAPPADCLTEECILLWVQKETQYIQARFDEATDLELQPEELESVEDLYKFKLNEVIEAALRMMGVREV